MKILKRNFSDEDTESFVNVWGYIYPLITDISYEYKGIRMEDRPEMISR